MARIVVADDDPAVRTGIVRYLLRLGHEVREAVDGREAIAAVANGAVDLVLTDVNMPDVDGIQVLRGVRALDPGMPVIVISGGGVIPSELLLGSAGLLGAYATIAKPFDLEDLGVAVARALASRAPPPS
jgi:two-component system response regulator AtoC